MAIAFDRQLGNNSTGVTAATSIQLTTANAVTAGATVFLLVGWFHATGTLTSVTGGLTWSIDKTVKNGSVSIALVSAPAPSGLAASTAVTANLSASSQNCGISGFSFTGVTTSSPVDATASATAATAAWTAGTCTTTNANDVVIGVCMNDDNVDGRSSTPTATWTEVPATAGDFPTPNNGGAFTAVYQIVSSTGSYTPGGTWTGSVANAGVSVAYMAAGGAPAVVVKQLSALGVG